MSVEAWHYPETDEWEIKNVDKADGASPTASVGSLDERIEGQTDSLFSGILSMLDSHHKMLKDHEEALLIVADTENKAADAINVSLWLGVVAIVIAVIALALEVLA